MHIGDIVKPVNKVSTEGKGPPHLKLPPVNKFPALQVLINLASRTTAHQRGINPYRVNRQQSSLNDPPATSTAS